VASYLAPCFNARCLQSLLWRLNSGNLEQIYPESQGANGSGTHDPSCLGFCWERRRHLKAQNCRQSSAPSARGAKDNNQGFAVLTPWLLSSAPFGGLGSESRIGLEFFETASPALPVGPNYPIYFLSFEPTSICTPLSVIVDCSWRPML
jgi:hypothetical protein